ncbi:envoplakin [Gouania willdenowi]|uniref:Envoplakin-like n=1 Tax=Gouania willdenowi TaxID=441366 RepID=A0A8C5DS07_GOUWI|nr:envoplakin-like [Gouania willdenowi]
MSSKKDFLNMTKNQAKDLSSVVARMQANADQVEKNILLTEKLLEEDIERDDRRQTLIHQKQNATNLAEAEGLLKNLFMDVDKAKKLQHPQYKEIERDVSNLHDRWVKDCATYRELYDQVQDLAPKAKIGWGPLLDKKLKQLKTEDYGPKLSDVEKQIAAHNILHQEIQAYNEQLQPSTTTSPEEYDTLKQKYAELVDSSQRRRSQLASLYDYMQSCSKELVYLSSQQERILQRDWSDRMVDPSGVRMEYEKFKNNGLVAHEQEINKLQNEGEYLVEMKHPGSSPIKAHSTTVQTEWQSFLNLCLAQEAHLENIDNYKKFQLDAEQLSESLDRLRLGLDPKSLNNKSNPEILLSLEGDEPALRRNDQRLADLKELSSRVVPLKLRRLPVSKPTTAMALCDWIDEEDEVIRGEPLILRSNSDNKNWELQNKRGTIKTLPGACFIIPAPDTEAMEKVNRLERELQDLKSSRSALMASLRSPSVEVVRPQRAVAVQSAPEDPRATDLARELDRINDSLEKCEKDILSRLRTPLDNRSPAPDLENRLKDQEKSVQKVRKLESEKAAVQRELEPILSKKPLGPITSTLPLKLSAATNKTNDINLLNDLYNTKAMSSLFLEKQITKVDNIVSEFEDQLVKDQTILDQPNSLQSRSRFLQDIRKDVGSRKDDLTKLGKDLDLTQQASRSLLQSFNEFCPDIQRQEKKVKDLNNRYTGLNQQLQERLDLVKQATNKNQDFQNAAQSLDFFLLNLPNNKLKPTDNVTQIVDKQNSQRKVVEDISRKSDDLDRVMGLSHDLQNVLNDYESNSNTYRGTLISDDDDSDEEPVPKRQPLALAKAVQRKERDLLNLYSEVYAENNQLLNQLGTAKNIVARNDDKVSRVVVTQQLQLQSQQRDLVEVDGMKKQLNDEITRRSHSERDLETYHKRFISLKARKGVERLEEKEVVHYYRDPNLEVELRSLISQIQNESIKRSKMQSEIEIVNEKIIKLELQLTKVEPKLVTKMFTEYERDPQLEKEAVRIREEIQRIRMELETRDTEKIQVTNEYTLLSHQKQKIKEKIVKKEVVKLEKNPEMLKSTITFKTEISEIESQCKSINDSIFATRKEINNLERIIPTIQPKIVSKVVTQVQQDPELLEESKKLRIALKEEKNENAILLRDLTTLQLHYSEVETIKQRVDIKEVINEIYRIDPETELELVRLKKELQDFTRNRASIEKEINAVMTSLTTQRAQKPKIEFKEVTQEVVKEEKSPEVIRELQRLNNQVNRLQLNYNTTLELLTHLRKERDELKTEKSKVETKLVTKEIIKYENDPLLEKEADRLRRVVREEIQQRRTLEECVFDLQNKYITLERQKPEEKIVMQEVILVQKDPKQILEHEKLNRNLDEEMKSRRKFELEVRQLRALVQEKERTLAQMDERQKKIQVESELRQIKARILEIETTPTPVEEKIVIEEILKVERDPQLDKLTDGLRKDMGAESTTISRLEREIRNVMHQLEILRKEKSTEKVVYREVVRVEKDPAVEAEREHLRDLVLQEKNLRRNLEDDIQNINIKVNNLITTKTVTSTEETTLISNRDALQNEKDDLLKMLRMLEAQRQSITVTFQQQTKLVSERNQMVRLKSQKSTAEVQMLEQEILKEKEKIHQKEKLIIELQGSIQKEDHSETHTRETNLSTKITILDPDTGKPLSPYEAYAQDLIDKEQYIKLSELECDWEEITSAGPDGDTTILQDRKSGKQYSVKEAMKAGRLTQIELTRYKEGKMPISELALLVAGLQKPVIPPAVIKSPTKPSPLSPRSHSKFPPLSPRTPSIPLSPLNSVPSSLRTSYPNLSMQNSSKYGGSLNNLSGSIGDESYPISGIFDTTTQSRMSVRSALTRKLIDQETALKLLEAQAASGGIVDLTKKDKLSVHKAAEQGLIDTSHMYKLLNAQKAFTGIEDPVTKERLAVGPAAQKGFIPPENAKRYMEAQYLTGGLVAPSKAGRLSVQDALAANLIDSATAKELEDETLHSKEIIDPITKEKMSYKQAMNRCTRDTSTGLLLLHATSTNAATTPSYSNYRFNSPNNRFF